MSAGTQAEMINKTRQQAATERLTVTLTATVTLNETGLTACTQPLQSDTRYAQWCHHCHQLTAYLGPDAPRSWDLVHRARSGSDPVVGGGNADGVGRNVLK